MRKVARAVKRRYGMAARPVAVRAHVAWYWRGLLMLAALSFGVGLAWWMYDVGGQFAGFDRGAANQELLRLRDRLQAVEEENRRLQAAQVKTDRHSQIDSAAQRDTELALKKMQEENAQLKEELAFFRGMTSGERAAGVNIYRFKVERASAGKYRYQVLLVQTGQQDKPFKGRLQLLVTMQNGDRKDVMTLPATIVAGDKFGINLNAYQKLEGDFQLAPAAAVKSVEARIFGEGSSQPRLTKTVSLS